MDAYFFPCAIFIGAPKGLTSSYEGCDPKIRQNAKRTQKAASPLLMSFSYIAHPAHIQKYSPNQKLGTPNFGSQNWPLKPPPACLGLDVPSLQILQMGAYQACQSVPSYYFTMLTQNWSIDFSMSLKVNKIGHTE